MAITLKTLMKLREDDAVIYRVTRPVTVLSSGTSLPERQEHYATLKQAKHQAKQLFASEPKSIITAVSARSIELTILGVF
jgi:hypothetical protein